MSKHTLISFLGKSKLNQQTGYRKANYDFGNGILKEVSFFGIGLTEVLKPHKLILIGTAGSMWDVFFDHHTPENEQVLNLVDAVAESRVDESLLTSCEEEIGRMLGCEVKCLIIDYAGNEAEQIHLLSQIAEQLEEGEEISMDVTHSFRHLPMLALVAARFLNKIKNICANNIYYGALEMIDKETGTTPVITLGGMLKMLDWVDALATYQQNGDFSPVAQLFAAENEAEAAQNLKNAAFYENTNQIAKARKPLQDFRKQQINKPLIYLFMPILQNRTQWVEQPRYADRQQYMAEHYLQQRDYLRAAILAQEALISRLVQQQGNKDPQNYAFRKVEKENLDQDIKDRNANKKKITPAQQAYIDLRDIRNALAHGARPHKADIQAAIDSEDRLKQTFQKILQEIKKL